MWFWLILGAWCVIGAAILAIDGRRRERVLSRDWELILTPRGEHAFRKLEDDVRAELELAELTYTEAEEARQRGDLDGALRLVDEGCQLIEEYAPRMVRALAAMAVLSRMAAAVAPVRPLRPRDFRLAQLVHLAQVSRFFHYLLVSTAERFRLRVYVLQRGFRTVAALALRWRETPAVPRWDGVDAANHDVGTLSNESLLTFRTLLVSLGAERRA
jgi:hypothetical protein